MTAADPLKTVGHRSIADVCALAGVPRRDWHLFRRWAGESLSSKALDQLHAYVDVMIAERCRNPGDDLWSQLIEIGLERRRPHRRRLPRDRRQPGGSRRLTG